MRGVARGEYFKWAARLTPGYLEKCVSVLDNDPGDRLRSGKNDVRGFKGHQRPSREKDRRLNSLSPGQRFWHVVIETHAIDEFYGVMRREVLLSTSRHGPFFGADKVLLAELAMLGRFYQIPENLFLRGAHPGQYYLTAKTRDMRKKWMDTKAKLAMPEVNVGRLSTRSMELALPLRDRAMCHLALMYLRVRLESVEAAAEEDTEDGAAGFRQRLKIRRNREALASLFIFGGGLIGCEIPR